MPSTSRTTVSVSRLAALGVLLLPVGATDTSGTSAGFGVVLAVHSPAEGYLDPCGCGGQDAGGLPRRAAMIADLRAAHPGLLVIDPGRLGMEVDKLPVMTRALAAIGVDAVGCGAEDLITWPRLLPLARDAGLPVTSLLPPYEPVPDDQLAPRSLVVGSEPNRLGVLSVAFGTIAGAELTELARTELARLRDDERVAFSVLIAHFGAASTERLVEALPADLRPLLIALATSDDEPAPAYQKLGCWWVPLAHKGRSLSLVTVARDGDGWRVEVEQKLVTAGPKDERIQMWVDDYYRRQKEGETAEVTTSAAPGFPPVSACLPCHEPAVSAWRKHPHARAVETLEQAGRDVASCLRCHDERLRRDGLRPAAEGDRGVVCATCHEDLPAHLAATETKPTTMAPAGCLTCHDREHSPRWAADRYLSAVAAACRAAAR